MLAVFVFLFFFVSVDLRGRDVGEVCMRFPYKCASVCKEWELQVRCHEVGVEWSLLVHIPLLISDR